jgi:hypothetical protein
MTVLDNAFVRQKQDGAIDLTCVDTYSEESKAIRIKGNEGDAIACKTEDDEGDENLEDSNSQEPRW